MSERKRIALLSSQLEETYQNEFIEGFLSQAFSLDYDVCTFATYRKEPESTLKEVGESNILSLIRYDVFDAVVVMADMLKASDYLINIENHLKDGYKGKVLYVEKESPIFPSIMLDHYDSMKAAVNHMIEVHGAKDIAFVSGHKWHAYSKQRIDAYKDALAEHGLPVLDDHIYYGDFWYDGGSNAVKEFMSTLDHLPEAIVCANDYMAIGAAEYLTSQGYNIPEDVAIVGYDSVERGRTSPQPITSVPLQAKSFGEYAASCIDALVHEKDMPVFRQKTELFIGRSCGCHNESIDTDELLRNKWSSIMERKGYFSSFTQLMEDLVLQTNFKDLLDAIQTYTYQIREFDAFHLCLNETWLDEQTLANDDLKRIGFTDQVVPVLNCGRSGEGADRLDFETHFDSKVMFPSLYEDAEKPRGFIFTPVFFNDICFGYSMISYGDEPKAYNDAYSLWMRSVTTGLESYRRRVIMNHRDELLEEYQITDSLTGMFNYAGFIKHAVPMIERGKLVRMFNTILAIDIAGLEQVNSKFGRSEGDRTIYELSQILEQCADEGAMICRLGNDEFIVAELTEESNHAQIHEVRRRIDEAIEKYNELETTKFPLRIYTGSCTARIETLSQMEDLVNSAVSRKNGNKASEQRMQNSQLDEDERKQADLVKKILDENLLTYHFQPIVSAVDGSIYAYEALMRSKTEQFVSPLDILKYANILNRLGDVERATLNNVMSIVESNPEKFAGKKVFINSIPGNPLSEEDAEAVGVRFTKFPDTIVIELTEQSEADDEVFERMNEYYNRLGVETAVDDYGTGYSNIVNLLRYMPDYVKIDRMLLSNIHENPQKQHFVKDIIIFAHENHFKVLAEGVENGEELAKVIELGTDLIQGYYTAKPNAEIVQSIADSIQGEICDAAASFK